MSPRVKVELTLLKVVEVADARELMIPTSYIEQAEKQIQQQARDYLNKIGEGIRSKKVSVKIRVGKGNAAKEIIKVADEIDVDLIVMSTHGRSGISRWAFGSATDWVLRRGHTCPLLKILNLQGFYE